MDIESSVGKYIIFLTLHNNAYSKKEGMKVWGFKSLSTRRDEIET